MVRQWHVTCVPFTQPGLACGHSLRAVQGPFAGVSQGTAPGLPRNGATTPRSQQSVNARSGVPQPVPRPIKLTKLSSKHNHKPSNSVTVPADGSPDDLFEHPQQRCVSSSSGSTISTSSGKGGDAESAREREKADVADLSLIGYQSAEPKASNGSSQVGNSSSK